MHSQVVPSVRNNCHICTGSGRRSGPVPFLQHACGPIQMSYLSTLTLGASQQDNTLSAPPVLNFVSENGDARTPPQLNVPPRSANAKHRGFRARPESPIQRSGSRKLQGAKRCAVEVANHLFGSERSGWKRGCGREMKSRLTSFWIARTMPNHKLSASRTTLYPGTLKKDRHFPNTFIRRTKSLARSLRPLVPIWL